MADTKGITEREYWLAVCYWQGRENGFGWDTFCDEIPDEYHPDGKDMYDRGVEDFSQEGGLPTCQTLWT